MTICLLYGTFLLSAYYDPITCLLQKPTFSFPQLSEIPYCLSLLFNETCNYKLNSLEAYPSMNIYSWKELFLFGSFCVNETVYEGACSLCRCKFGVFIFCRRHLCGNETGLFQTVKQRQLVWFLVGNGIYYIAGISMAFIFGDYIQLYS
ncbi:hypothetical protein Barb7_01843 [Bacteroidales bacterium Barb7]|nr:hypothetical protein Barb7_01843 [Bacteroidales bacterium Barb7]